MALVLGLAACSDSGHVVTNAPTSNERAWVAGHLPGGFEIVSADDREERRTVGYAPRGDDDYQISITASTPEAAPSFGGSNQRSTRVRGHEATLFTLTDEGHDYGLPVTWDECSDLRIVVEGSNGPSEEDTLAVAEGVRGIPDAEWQRLLVELSLDTHLGRVDPTATPVEIARGMVGNDDYVLTALIPGGYPLGPEDRRADCFHLAFRDETTRTTAPAIRSGLASAVSSSRSGSSMPTSRDSASPRARAARSIHSRSRRLPCQRVQPSASTSRFCREQAADKARCLALISGQPPSASPTTAN